MYTYIYTTTVTAMHRYIKTTEYVWAAQRVDHGHDIISHVLPKDRANEEC